MSSLRIALRGAVANKTAKQNLAYSVVLPEFFDENGDALTYGMVNLPPGLSFNASTRTISGTPTTAGSWTVSYTANDGRGGVTGTTFVFAIAEPVGNQPPVVTNPLADQLLMGGAGFSFTFPANTFADLTCPQPPYQ